MAASCPTCGGTGYEIITRGDGFTGARRCGCSYEDQGRSLLRAARIPKRYADRSFENFDLNPEYPSLGQALEYAREWVERWPDVEGQGILWFGRPGTGKTHLAVATLVELACSKGARVLFYEQRELFKTLQGTFAADSTHSEAQVLAPILGADVLLLDDLGAGRTTHWSRDVLHEVISHRYNHGLPLLLTTNCPLGGEDDEEPEDAVLGALTLRQRLGDALMSRLYEMCRIVRLEGEDFRKKIFSAEIRRH